MQTANDVVILGGGLAGLTLAIQLRQRDPSIAVTVLERRAHPVREAAHKVGESSVEIGAHYFADVLGFREHLETQQVRKFGLRYFFSDRRDDVQNCIELGVSQCERLDEQSERKEVQRTSWTMSHGTWPRRCPRPVWPCPGATRRRTCPSVMPSKTTSRVMTGALHAMT